MQNVDIERLDATFGARVSGLRLSDLPDPQFDELRRLWVEHSLLVIPGQFLSEAEQIAFARRFGPLEIDLIRISNLRSTGAVRDPANTEDNAIRLLKGNEGWHADSTYMSLQAKGAVFSAVTIPSQGAQTEFADMAAAYEALDAQMKSRVAQLRAYHSIRYSQARMGHKVDMGDNSGGYSGYGFGGEVPLRSLVKVHPETGRPALLIGRHAHAIPGLSPEESEQLLDELERFACQGPRVYQHDWRLGDVIIWDNRCLMHRAVPYDMHEPRVMLHSRIAGDPVAEAWQA